MGLVRYNAEDESFQIYMGANYSGTYDMKADRILSAGGVLDFIWQVHHHPWITGQHLKDLLDCITCYTEREHGQLPQLFYQVTHAVNGGLDAP